MTVKLKPLTHDADIEALRLSGLIKNAGHDTNGVQNLCDSLTGMTGLTMFQMRERLFNIPLPADQHSCRLFDHKTGDELRSVWGYEGADISAFDIAMLIGTHLVFKTNAWRRTWAAPQPMEPGVLDLLVDIDTIPRPMNGLGIPDLTTYIEHPFGWQER